MILGMSLSNYLTKYLWTYLLQTLKMVGITLVIALVFGLLLGMVLFLCRKSKQKPLRILYKVLDFIVGILRSFPFYILIFVLITVS